MQEINKIIFLIHSQFTLKQFLLLNFKNIILNNEPSECRIVIS